MAEDLQIEFEYYIEHQDELVEKYQGKCIVIKGEDVLGAYDDEVEAIKETMKNHELGSFLTQLCEPGSDSYSCNIYSQRVYYPEPA